MTQPPAPLPPSTIDKLASTGRLQEYGLSEILFAIGDHGDEMYLVQKGAVDLFFEPGKKPKRLGPNSLFGELAFIIGDHERTATAVVAEDGTRLRIIEQEALDELLNTAPKEVFSVVRRACSYLVESERSLIRQVYLQNRELEMALGAGPE